ncbi:hypothetical protein EAI_11945 [Harpegnathos saltator]|uniref:Uncharacterized protein n=1 Tax=Harpegnathos saltator TaxID=610380 RepID=E2B8L4_HARSA|nr:hypothetical protein EAI_11945 [Harpegnathos saltator]
MAKNKCGENLDTIEELKVENTNSKTSLNDIEKEMEEVKETLRSIKEMPPPVVASSSPPQQTGNVGRSIKRAPQLLADAPSPPVYVEGKEEEKNSMKGRITPPLMDMMEMEEEPIGVIEIQKGLIPKEKVHPVGKAQNEARVAKAEGAGPKIRENIPLKTKIRVERMEESRINEDEGIEGKMTKVVIFPSTQSIRRMGITEGSGKEEGRKRGDKEGDSQSRNREKG